MARRLENGLHRIELDDPSALHHRHPVGHTGHRAQIMGDEHQCHAALALELRQQGQDLRLNGDIERSRGLVRNQQRRLAGERDRDHDPLPQTPRQLVGVLLHAALGVGHVHTPQQRQSPPARFAPGDSEMPDDRLGDLFADRNVRRQRGHRVLEYHADAGAAHPVEIGRSPPDEIG